MTNPNPLDNSSTGFVLDPTLYNRLKFFVQVFLPAFSSLYFGLSAIWGLPAAEQVVGTCALLATFIGALVFVSARNYNNSDARFDGVVVDMGVNPDTGRQLYSLEVNGDPEMTIRTQKQLVLKTPD